MYKLTEGSILKDGMSIPKDPANRDYQQFLQDVIDGAVVEGEDVIEPSYAELRAAEYPSIAQQMDMQFHNPDQWKAIIQAVKDKYPKTITGGKTVAPVPAWVQEEAGKKLFQQQLVAYKQATARLEQYVVADGRPEIKEMQPTGETVFNEETGEMEYILEEVIVQTAIDPVEPTVEQTTYSDDPEVEPITTIIENPLITTDNAERAEAQAVVDATPQAVKEAV